MSTLIASSSNEDRVNLLGLSRAQLEEFFLELGEKRFRTQQVMKWIHHQGITDFDKMSNDDRRRVLMNLSLIPGDDEESMVAERLRALGYLE